MRRFNLVAAAVAILLASAAPVPPPQVPPVGAREGLASSAMVAAANPHAVEAGLRVLRAGGSAIDAAVAVQATLGLVEPQSSGLGGGGFLVHYDARTREVRVYDGRETAPAGARANMFLGPDGKPLPFVQAVLSGRATGAPGAVAALAMAQKRHGRLPWQRLFAYPETLAGDGFLVSPRLARFTNGDQPQAAAPDAARYFSGPDGRRLQVGERLVNRAYAQTLSALARQGPAAILTGPLAREIEARVHAPPLPGTLTAADLASYHPRTYEAVCGPYRVYLVCTAAPPSSGAALLLGLAILQRTDIASRGPSDAQAWFLFAEASRLMYADRDRYFADPAFVRVPVPGLLDPAYAARRAALIGKSAGPAPEAGLPTGAPAAGEGLTREPAGTSHFVVVDRWGNTVSMTTTVESVFGTGRMAGGFFLNNQMTDFSFTPVDAAGRPVPNAVAPGKRPRSSMSPVIVLDRQGRFVAALGSPGGNSIPAYNLKALVGLLDWGLSMQQAIELPNLVARGESFAGEVDRFAPGVIDGLKARGIAVRPFSRQEESGLHGVRARGGRLEGGADPRREGVARGF
ncbi:MAG TPA: gamma-glutamyltransferase [Caulobacteraceae bacterium]|jgi:gamma-glutamyltranspeptidase/glutathione hydrolase